MPTQAPAINSEIKYFQSGCFNLLDDTLIPADASSDEKNWYTQDGHIKLVGGRSVVGTEGLTGAVYGEIFGYKTDGSTVHYAKMGTKIQYFNGTTWIDCITGLTETADYAFSNYSSLAGAFTFFFGVDGIWKVNNANPGSPIALLDSTKNWGGRAFIDKGRTILWNRAKDKTGIYGSYIDAQNSTVYTTVSSEATTSLTGTLAFKAGGATRNCFGVTITLTVSGEVFTDGYLGVLTGSLGNTGTINYATGAYTLSIAGIGTASYQWEDSNSKGLTDFTHSTTRTAGQGFQFPQDINGDAILNVFVGQDGAYYSLKSGTAYRLFIADDDTVGNTTNEVFYQQLGMQSWRGGMSTQLGIVFINTANPDKPEMTILRKNPIGGNVEPIKLFPQFKFSNYDFTDCCFETVERYIVIACKTKGSSFNNIILLADPSGKSIDITNYSARTFAKDTSGNLYGGSPVSLSVFKLFNGFDDNGLAIDNYWIGKGEVYQLNTPGQSKVKRFVPAYLKKHRKLRFRGWIDPNQAYEVYVDYDDSGPQLVGTVRGDGSYVDYANPQPIGDHYIGQSQIGGDDNSSSTNSYPYFCEIRIKKPPKFMKRKIMIKAIGIGYVDIAYQNDFGLMFFNDKLPTRFRQKQNVSKDGKTVDQPTPEF